MQEQDLWAVSWRDSAARLLAGMNVGWRLEKASAASAAAARKPSLLRAVLRAFHSHRAVGLLLPCISFVKIVQSFAL